MRNGGGKGSRNRDEKGGEEAGQSPFSAVIVTGHSLGGGLASAASVMGNLEADTFNASGLVRATIEREGDAMALARYDTENDSSVAILIKAYQVNTDILTLLQKNIDAAQKAIGREIVMAGPFGQSTEIELWEDVQGVIAAAEDPDLTLWQRIKNVLDAIGIDDEDEKSSILADASKFFDSHKSNAVLYALLGPDASGYTF